MVKSTAPATTDGTAAEETPESAQPEAEEVPVSTESAVEETEEVSASPETPAEEASTDEVLAEDAADSPEPPAGDTPTETSASISSAAAEDEAAAAAAADPPSRGHVRRDGGKEHLSLPATATENVTVTDMTTYEEVPASGYDVVDGRVVRRGGVWAAGADRWLVEYDRG
ncbi:hypothetical protein [Blastococcus sp. CT_GayMR16]|uniref:hypothetical protein n=1 Tax=Blastococcus sp. CT_GayMR16 TaxID=2559607 RepID=UPI00107303A7|nr:hypothetical protein [Blastococcus sp. CT_GayMR16]TFV83157.1 hypothetical protein E4P38_21105 [Blastococcus sp. CT_GayMR16]